MLPTEQYGTVIFDCDATLSEIGGIEELGREHRAEVEVLTDAAMSGRLPLEEVFGRRLALAQPSRTRVLEVGQLYVDRLVPDAGAVVATLPGQAVDMCTVRAACCRPVLVLTRARRTFGVMAAADVVIRQCSLAPVLPLALERPPSTEPARSLYQRGLSMLELNLER